MTRGSGRLFSSVAIRITNRCNITCSHCMPESGPRVRSRLDVDTLRGWIEQLADVGTSYVSLTGGEPFIAPELVLAASELCAARGISVGVMTNAFWARDREAALQCVDRYPGIGKYGISTDRFHWEQLPIERVKFAIEALRERRKTVVVRAAYTAAVDDEVGEVLARLGAHREQIDVFEAQPVIHLGRARSTLPEDDIFDMGEAAMSRCDVADTPIIDEAGFVFACCGPSMSMGVDGPLCLGDLSAESVATIADRAERNLSLQVIRTFGPGRLLSELVARGRPRPSGRLRHMCDVCTAACGSHAASAAVPRLPDDAALADTVGRVRLVQFADPVLLS